MGIVVALGLAPRTAAQQAPCRPGGDSLLSLGKAAFFWSIERGAFAIGERSLDDLTDGLVGVTAAKSSSRAKRSGTMSPAQARTAVFPTGSDEPLVSGLSAYVESPSSEAADAAFQAFLESATRILFETPPEKPGETGRVGLAIEERQISNRGTRFGVADMVNERARRNLEYSFFGDGADLLMGKVQKLLGEAPFFKAPGIADGKNLDRNNLGIEVRSEMDLRALWFKDYRDYLAAEAPGRPAAQVTEALNAGWPGLQKFWAFKRTEIFLDRAQTTFGTEMREVYERATARSLPRRDCEP